jgi:hypothetical protein
MSVTLSYGWHEDDTAYDLRFRVAAEPNKP